MSQPVERFHINHVASATLKLICLVTLILKLVRIIARRVDNLPTNFGVSEIFHSQLTGHLCQTHHVTLRP